MRAPSIALPESVIRQPIESRYDSWAVYDPISQRERCICGYPQHLQNRGYVVLCTVVERLMQIALVRATLLRLNPQSK